MPIEASRPSVFGVYRRVRFFLNNLIDLLEIREVHRVDRVEGFAGDVDEVRRRRVSRLRQRVDAKVRP
jgi:hypothetical protein